MRQIVLTEAEARQIKSLVEELPFKYHAILAPIVAFLEHKLQDAQAQKETQAHATECVEPV